jgi:DNA-binding NtrC family response regulator
MLNDKPKILAIDDDNTWLEQVPLILEDHGEITTAQSIDQGLAAIQCQFFDVILLDLNFDGDSRTGLDVFRKIQSMDSGADVVVISGETRPDKLIEILNAGITQFLTKPALPEAVRTAVATVISRRDSRLRAINQAVKPNHGSKMVELIGSSRAMQNLRADVQEAVESGAKDILLLGETGTGKEVVAKLIAQLADPSRRFIPIHCGAISDGIAESELFGHVKGAFTGADRDRASAFEAVGGGFVFLDEIGDMPLHQQAKLLRVIQERKVQRVGSIEERSVSFRSISATNANLETAIKEKRFREDLFYRVAKIKIVIPPLREHLEDVPELVHYFLSRKVGKPEMTVTEGALALLKSFHWPGNIRQLEAAVELMAFKTNDGVIREKHVCQVVPEIGAMFVSRFNRPFLGKKGAAFVSGERKRFEGALIEARGDRNKAAEILKVSRATFFRRAKELGIIHGRRQQIDSSRSMQT